MTSGRKFRNFSQWWLTGTQEITKMVIKLQIKPKRP